MLVSSIMGTRLIMQACRCHSKQMRCLVLPQIARCLSTTSIRQKRVGPVDPEMGHPPKRKNFRESLLPPEWHKLIDRYPEFLPDPINNTPFMVARKIDDMLARRTVVEIPEFYVGSILAITVSDKNSETKKGRFVGICIQRTGQLTHASFTLRNVIDGMGCEIRYDLYNPLILSIEVLRLERRLDDTLIYLRDALPEFSTFPEDMKPDVLEPGAEVPINKTLVKMKPFPWSRHWDRWLFKGVEKFENVPEYFAQKVKVIEDNPVYSYDLMLEYRRHCTEELMYNICKRLWDHELKVVQPRNEAKTRRFLRMDQKIAPIKESKA